MGRARRSALVLMMAVVAALACASGAAAKRPSYHSPGYKGLKRFPHVVRARRISVPVIGFRDGITVTLSGIGADGRHGPVARAVARRTN